MKPAMKHIRAVEGILDSVPTVEGAGVHLKRAFGNDDPSMLDPFLLLDYFHSNNPRDYSAGFPFHPHRGIETVTYVLKGSIEHSDSMGNRGVIGPGDVQWMTAGSGIIHQEMPLESKGGIQGLQLWINLPAAKKMMDPRYREVKKGSIGEYRPVDGVKVKVIAGRIGGIEGAVRDLTVDVEYLDITMEPEKEFVHSIESEHKVFAYVLEGSATFEVGSAHQVGAEKVVVYGDGDGTSVRSGTDGTRFLLVSGKPIGEPIAWRGPVVMNTDEELTQAFQEIREGTFVKFKPSL